MSLGGGLVVSIRDSLTRGVLPSDGILLNVASGQVWHTTKCGLKPSGGILSNVALG